MVTPEEGVDRFRDNEDEDTPMAILPADSCGITVMEAYIPTLQHEGISVDEDNYPDPENCMHSEDVLPPPSQLTFLFHGFNPWCHGGNFPVGRDKLKMASIPIIQHMSRLKFFIKLYFMEYSKDVVIPETNNRLNSDMNLSEYFCVVGFRLIMACYVVHSVRDFFFKDAVTP